MVRYTPPPSLDLLHYPSLHLSWLSSSTVTRVTRWRFFRWLLSIQTPSLLIPADWKQTSLSAALPHPLVIHFLSFLLIHFLRMTHSQTLPVTVGSVWLLQVDIVLQEGKVCQLKSFLVRLWKWVYFFATRTCFGTSWHDSRSYVCIHTVCNYLCNRVSTSNQCHVLAHLSPPQGLSHVKLNCIDLLQC